MNGVRKRGGRPASQWRGHCAAWFFGVVFAAILPSAWAQTPDPSIGRNIPGAVAAPARDEFAPAPAVVDEVPLPSGGPYGLTGRFALRRVVFSGALSAADRGEGVEVAPGVWIDRVDLLDGSRAFGAAVSRDFIGRPLDDAALKALVEKTFGYYFRAERPLVVVQPTGLDESRGEVRIAVIEATLGAKRAEGAHWFSNERLLGTIRAKVGQPINRGQLLNDIEWLNANPFRQSAADLQPGQAPATTDIVLRTQDRFPVRVYGQIDNTGSEQTGAWRWGLGVNWGDALWLGHQLNLQISAPIENFSSQPVYAFSYLVPLPWRHRFSIFGSYALTDVDYDFGAAGTYNYRGYQGQLSPRYAIPLGRLYGKFTHEVTLGFDAKSTDLSFVQGGDVIPSNKTTVMQFVLGCDATLEDAWGSTQVSLDTYWSPGGIGNLNTTAAYQQVDPRLQADYFYGVASVERTTTLPAGFELLARVTGQIASTSLPSSEQLSIGGWGTVRGYDAYVLLGDQGLYGTIELQSPRVPLLSRWWPKLPADHLRLVGFWDYGFVNTIDPLPGDPATSQITSVGVGVRYQFSDSLSARCDLGFPLLNPDLGFPVDTVGLNVGVTLQF